MHSKFAQELPVIHVSDTAIHVKIATMDINYVIVKIAYSNTLRYDMPVLFLYDW